MLDMLCTASASVNSRSHNRISAAVLVIFIRHLGPLHMSPVNWAGLVSEILPCHSFLCKNIDVFI